MAHLSTHRAEGGGGGEGGVKKLRPLALSRHNKPHLLRLELGEDFVASDIDTLGWEERKCRACRPATGSAPNSMAVGICRRGAVKIDDGRDALEIEAS